MSRVQYGIWPNCCNACDFCLNLREQFYNKEKQIQMIRNVRDNIDCVDWEGRFFHGISLLGGELYFIQDPDLQEEFLKLIDDIIEKIILKVRKKTCVYSTVTNGLYNPEFLFKVLDKFAEKQLLEYVDLSFSYDLKHRFHTEERKQLCESNIRATVAKYPELHVNVQMILTQYLINEFNKNNNIFQELQDKLTVDNINLLFPHKHNTGKELEDFYFNRKDLLQFLYKLHDIDKAKVNQFVYSIINVDNNAFIGLYRRHTAENDANIDTQQQPLKEDVKQIINPKCGHSVMYQCYADSDKCLYCDIRNFQC